MGILSKIFPPSAVKTMLSALDVVCDDLTRNCNLSLFGGTQALDAIRKGVESSLRQNTKFVEQLLEDGKTPPLQGIWKLMLTTSRNELFSGVYNEEGRSALTQIFHRSVSELMRLGFFNEERAREVTGNFTKRFAEFRF